jgi:hypothetical protein
VTLNEHYGLIFALDCDQFRILFASLYTVDYRKNVSIGSVSEVDRMDVGRAIDHSTGSA